MLRKIIEADQLPEYTLAMTQTVDGAPAVLGKFARRGQAAELHAPELKPTANAGSAWTPIAGERRRWTT